jgi:hypothetical protein
MSQTVDHRKMMSQREVSRDAAERLHWGSGDWDTMHDAKSPLLQAVYDGFWADAKARTAVEGLK